MPDRFPGYDVMAKRHTPSWNEQTRRVIDERLAVPGEPRFFTADEFATVHAIASRMVPQPTGRAPIPVAALVDHRLHSGKQDGYRRPGVPRDGDAWRQGLRALDGEAQSRHGAPFRHLPGPEQDALLHRMEHGDMHDPAWGDMPPEVFFTHRMGRDVVMAYYAHPTAWNEIGFGGPASPRGYVRMGYNDRDPWEATEAPPQPPASARWKNHHAG